MSDPATILINNYPILQSLVNQKYNSINEINIYDTALRTKDSFNNYILINFINYTLTVISNPHFINTIVYKNPNILLFFAQNPNLMTYFSNPLNLTIYNNFLTSEFTNLTFGFTDNVSNPKTDLFCFISSYFITLTQYLSSTLSQNCPQNGIIQIHSSIFGTTSNITKLLSSYPLINYLVNQNYMYEIYYNNLFNNANLVQLLLTYPSLLNVIILGDDNQVNPNILNLLGYYTNLAYDFSFNNNDASYFLNIPNIQNINNNLYDLLITTPLSPYLDNTLIYPIITELDQTDLNRNILLNNYPSLNILINQNYNYNLYYNILQDKNIVNLLTFALLQYNLNLITPIYDSFPNIINDIINFNPNLLALFYDNPNLTIYLSTNAKTLYDFLVFKGSETYNIKNPNTDLYNNFAAPFLSIKNLSYLLNANPNPAPTNGIVNIVGNGSSSLISLYNNNVTFFYLLNQNYVFNMYYNNLFYNRLLLDLLNNIHYDKNSNTYINNFLSNSTYTLFLDTIGLNPNIINFLCKNPRLLSDYLSINETNVLDFLNIPNITLPYYDLNDILFEYDTTNNTNYVSYLEKSYSSFFESSLSNINNLKSLVSQNYDNINNITGLSVYIPSNYNNNQNIYNNLFINNDQFIHFIKFFLNQNVTYNIITIFCNNPNLLTFLSNNYQLLFYYKNHILDFSGFLQYQNNSALLPTTDLTNLTIQYSLFKYPLTPNTISQYLNNTLPIAGPNSGIGNNPQILQLLNNYTSLDTLSKQNYNYNIFYYNLYNHNNMNIVTFINNYPEIVQIIEKNPLLVNFLYRNQNFVNEMNKSINREKINLFLNLTIIHTPYINIFDLIKNNALYPYLNIFKSYIYNYKNISSLVYQDYIHSKYDLYQNLYYENLNDQDLLQFIYYALNEYSYHNNTNPSSSYYPYVNILDIVNTNPNILNFFKSYTHARNYLMLDSSKAILNGLLKLNHINDPYTNLYTLFKNYALSEGYNDLLNELNKDVNPFVSTYSSASYNHNENINLVPIYLSNNIELLLTYPKIKELCNADYNNNIYYKALYSSEILQKLLLKYLSNNNIYEEFINILYKNPNIILFLAQKEVLAEVIYNDDNLYNIFVNVFNVEIIISDLNILYKNSIFNIYLNTYVKSFLENFPQFQTLYNQDYLNITHYNLYNLNQKIIEFIYYALQLNYEDYTFPNFINILEKNPNILNFLNMNDSILDFFKIPSNKILFKSLLLYSYTTLSTILTIDNPITDLYTFFHQFKIDNTLTYNLNNDSNIFNSNIISITNIDTPTLSYPSIKLNTLFINYDGLNVIVNQKYNSNIYYYALQNEYLVDLIYNALKEYHTLVWSTNIIYDVIYKNPNFLSFLYKNPRLTYYYYTHINTLEPLLNFISASPLPSTLDLYAFVFSDPILKTYLETPTLVADLSNIGVVKDTIIGANKINNLSNIIYQNYNQNMYYKHLYNNRTLNNLINSSVTLQNLIAKNPNIVNFLAYYPDLTNDLYSNPMDLAIFLDISTLEVPITNIENEINDFAPSLNIYINNASILYKILNNTLLGILISQKYNHNIYFEALYKNVDLIYLLYYSSTNIILPYIYKNPSLLIFLSNQPSNGNLLDYIQYDISQIDYINPFLNIANISNMLTNLYNIPFKYYLLKNASISSGSIQNIFTTLLDQDYNINSENIIIYEKSIYNNATCDYIQFIFDKYFFLYGISNLFTGYTYDFPNIFELFITNPNIINFLYNNQNIMSYHRSRANLDYSVITNFWGILNKDANYLTKNINSLLSNPEFYIYSSYYTPNNAILYELGNSISNLITKYPIFTNLLQQYYNNQFYQDLLYNSTSFQTFINTYPLSIVFNAFSFNANIISFLAFNVDLTNYFITNSADIYYFLNNLDTQNPSKNLNEILLYNDLNRPLLQSNSKILYTLTKNYLQNTLNNPSYVVLKDFYSQLYNKNIYITDLQNQTLISFVYLNTRLYNNFNPILMTPLPNFLSIIESNPNILNFLNINNNFINYLSNDIQLNTTNPTIFTQSYIYQFFTYFYIDPLLSYTFTIYDPLTNYYTFLQKLNSTLYNLLTPLNINIYDIGTTTELTDLINANPKLEVLLNQLYNSNVYYNILYQNNYFVTLLSSSNASVTTLLNNIYDNPNILLFIGLNPNLIIAFLNNFALLHSFNTLPNVNVPNTNIYEFIMNNSTYDNLFGSYLITKNELYIQNFVILTSLKNQFYLHEFYLHKLIPIDSININHTLYHYRNNYTNLMKFIDFYYNTIYVPNIFTIFSYNPNYLNYLYYHNSLLQYLTNHPKYLQSYSYLTNLSNPLTNLSTFTIEYFTNIEENYAVTMIHYDDEFNQLYLENRDNLYYENNLLILLNNNPNLNQLVYQNYNYNYALSPYESIYLYHLKIPNIIELLSLTEYNLLETIYKNPNLLVFLTNNPNLVNYLNNFSNEINILKSLNGINNPITNLYDLFTSNPNFSIYLNSREQFIYDGYQIFKNIFAQAYNQNIYYTNYRNNNNLIDLIYTSILYTTPTLADIFETNINVLLFLSYNPNLVIYLNNHLQDLIRFVHLPNIIYPSTNVYNYVVQNLSYLKSYLSQIPIGLNSNVGTTPDIITLLNQFNMIESIIDQNYNQNIYYIHLYNNPNLVTLLSTNEMLRNAFYYNNNILQFLNFNPLLLAHFFANPSDLYIFLTNNGILDPITNLYDFIVTYLPALSPLLNESLTGIYSTIGIKDNLTILLNDNPKLSTLINQNYNSNIYYYDLYNNDDLVTLLSTKSTITTISSSQLLLNKIYKNPNILNFLNNNPSLISYFLTNSDSFILFIQLQIENPTTNIDNLVKSSLPYLTVYLTQISIGLNSNVGTTTQLTNLIQNNIFINNYANNQNYINNLYYSNLYNVPDLVTLITENATLLNSYINQNPNILNYLASNPKLCSILLQSSEKLNIFLQLPNINLMSTNIQKVICDTQLYANVNSIEEILKYNYFQNNFPQFYNDYIFDNSFALNSVSFFMYNNLSTALPNSAEIFRLNPNFINFLFNNPAFTNQLNLEYLSGYTYNCENILSIPEVQDSTKNITTYVTNYIQSPENITLTLALLNQNLPKVGLNSYIGKKNELNFLLSVAIPLNELVSQNYNENIYYKSLYYNDYLVSLLLTDYNNNNNALLNLIYKNNTILNFLAYNPQLVIYLNKNISEISILTNNQYLYNTNSNIYEILLQTTLKTYLNTPITLLSSKYDVIKNIIDQKYNSVNGSNNLNLYYNALQNPYVSYIIYYGANLSANTQVINIIDYIQSNMNIILFLFNNIEFTKYMIYNESAYLEFIQLPNINLSTTNITYVVQTKASLSIYLNKNLVNGGLSSGIGSTTQLTTLLTNNTILNNIVSTNYINNIYYINMYNNPNLVSLINNSTQLLQYIYTNPNIINFLAKNPTLVSYMLTNSVYVTSFLEISNVGIMETNLDYQYVLYNILLNTYILLKDCVNQIYNLLPNIPYLYKNTLNNLNVLEFIYFTLQNVTSINLVSNIIYGNPNFINFLYDNPNLITYFTQNISILQNFMTLPGLDTSIMDLYELVKYYATYSGNSNISTQLNQSPRIVGINSGIGTNSTLSTLIENNSAFQSLINQNYNLNIYYTYLITYPSIVDLLFNNFNLLYSVYKNPNIITFLGNNPKLLAYFIVNPYAIELFLSIPNVDNPMYDLYTLISDYDTISSQNVNSFQSLLNRSLYVLLSTYPNLETLVFQFTNVMNTSLPTSNTLNYQMNNTYFYTLSTLQNLVDFIYINLSNSGLPNIITDKILKNPNIINYLGSSDLTFFNNYINSVYKSIITNPLIDDPANDIYEINIPLFNPNPTYFINAFYPKKLLTIANESAYFNNVMVNNLNIHKIIQQNYNNKIFEYNLISPFIEKNDLVRYLLNTSNFPYLNFLINLIPNNPLVINFLVNNPFLLQNFIDVPNNFLQFSSLIQIIFPYQNIETLVQTKPIISPYLSINAIVPNLSTHLQTLISQKYNNAIYRNVIYSNTKIYQLLISNPTFLTKAEYNPNLLLFLHKNPDLLNECYLNPLFFNILLGQAYITNVTTNLYNTLALDPNYSSYLYIYTPQNISYTTFNLTTLISTYPLLESLLSQKYMGNSETNIYYDNLYYNPNLVTLLLTYPTIVNAIYNNPNIINFLSKNCANPASSGVISFVDYLIANPLQVPVFLGLLPIGLDQMNYDLYTIYQSSLFNTYLTITNLPLLYTNALYTNVLSYVNESYNNDLYFNALHENNGIYDFINYVYNIYNTVTPTPFRNIYLLLNNNSNILLYLRENRSVATYLTNPLHYNDTLQFMNIPQIDDYNTNIELSIKNRDYLNPSPPSIPLYTTIDLTTLLNNNPKLKIIAYQNYNNYIYYNNLYKHPNVVTLLLKNSDEYEALMPLIITNPTIINFFCMYPDLVSALYNNVSDFLSFIAIVGLTISSNNLIELVGATYLKIYLNQEYIFVLENYPILQNLIYQPYNEAIYYKYMNQNKNIPLLINKYAGLVPSIVNDIISLNPNIITFLGNNPALTLELYNNDTKYINDFLPLFGTFATPNANNSPSTNLYNIILSIPSLSPFLNPIITPFPSYSTVPLTNLLTTYPLLNSIIQQNYNDYIYYKNLYKVPSLVTLLTNNPTLIPFIYNNPNIINNLSYSLYMINMLNSTPSLVTEFITYSTGKNPTYPNTLSTNNNYLYSMNNLYGDNNSVNKNLWKYTNTAYLGYGTLNSEFIVTPLFYSFNLLDNIGKIPYNEDTFYRAIYQNIGSYGLNDDYLINLLGYINKNYSNASFLTSISYNPHLLTFLYNNPNFLLQLKNNLDICEMFIFSQTISLCATDLYNFYNNTIPAAYFNNNLEITYSVYSVVSKSLSLKNILLQNYNYAIYYTAVASNQLFIKFLLYIIDNNPLFVSQICSNPNILLFLSNNQKIIQYLLDNPSNISIFTTNPNILNVQYNLINIVLSTTLENYLDNNTLTLLTQPNNSILNLMNCQYNNNIVLNQNRGSLSPAVPQNDYYNVNLYYDNIMKNSDLAKLINYAFTQYTLYNNNLLYNMSDYPNIINDILNKNPNVMNFLIHNPNILQYLYTPVEVTFTTKSPLYRFLTMPIIKNPQKDISLYISNNANYADFKVLLNSTIYIPSELNYLNSQTVISSNPIFYEFVNQNYNNGIYVINLFNYTNKIISLFIENSTSLFYNVIYENPNIINFLVYYPDLTNFLNNYPNTIPIFINIPNVANIMLNLYNTIINYSSTTSLLSSYFTTYLGDNSNIITYQLNYLLIHYPQLYILFYNNNSYNNIIFNSMINSILFTNNYTNLAYTYPYIMDISLKNIPLIPYLSNNSYGDDSLILYLENNPNKQIYEIEKLSNHINYVLNMNLLISQNYNFQIYKKVFYYNTIYGSISKFITDVGCYNPLLTNMNILLFIYNNPRLLEFYYNDGQSDILGTNNRFNNLFNQCTLPTTNITNVFKNDLILKYYLNSNLINGGLSSGVPINPQNPNLIPLLNSNPTLNALVSQNYIFNLYFIELNNNPTLVNLIYTHSPLLPIIYTNPNIINFLYNNSALTIYLYNAKVCNRDYVDLITTNPSITNIYTNLFTIYENTSLQSFLNYKYFIPPFKVKRFLENNDTLNSIVNQQYNANIYYNSIKNVQNMISLISNNPNIIDYIALNPNIINFMAQNPKFIDFYKFFYGENISNLIFLYQLTNNIIINSTASYGIIDNSTIQSATNPIIDLYKFYYQKLPEYLNNNPNNLASTNGFGSNSALNNLLKTNKPLEILVNQNYNYNIYKLFLLFNSFLVNTFTKYNDLLFYFVYKNTNMLNFLFFNNTLLNTLLLNPSYVSFFITLTFCQNPVVNLYDVIYQYDISNNNPIKLSTYFEKVMYLDLIGNIGPDSILIDNSSGYP